MFAVLATSFDKSNTNSLANFSHANFTSYGFNNSYDLVSRDKYVIVFRLKQLNIHITNSKIQYLDSDLIFL